MFSKTRPTSRAAPAGDDVLDRHAGESIVSKVKRYTGGRPCQEDAVKRDARLIEIAARMFMQRGFEATTIDAVADAASIGKATLYARYRDKAALFEAVFQRQIDRWVIPLCQAAALPTTIRVEDALLTVSRRLLAVALAPEAIMVHRILISEASRFPELARIAHDLGWHRSNTILASVLMHYADDGQIAIGDPELAAEQFLSLVVGRQTRLALLGIVTDPAQIERRMHASIDLFLDGVRPRG